MFFKFFRRSSSMTSRFFVTSLFLFAVQTASAGVVPLDTSNPGFGGFELNNGDTASDGNTILTFSNVLNNVGSAFISVSSLGILLGDGGDADAGVSFDIVFDSDTVIDQYTIGDASTNPAGFMLSGVNGTTGSNALNSLGTFSFDMGTIPFFQAGTPYSLTHDAFDAQYKLQSIVISNPSGEIPTPTVLVLLCLAIPMIRLSRNGSRLSLSRC